MFTIALFEIFEVLDCNYFADSGVSFGSVSVFFTQFCYDIDLMVVKPPLFRACSSKYQIYFRVHVGKLGKPGIPQP